MTEDRPIQSTTVDGVSVTFQTPEQQQSATAREAERKGLRKRKSLTQFLRVFGVGTKDRP